LRSYFHSVSRPSKKRKAGPPPGVEIISISDDEDSDQSALDRSIVVSRTKHRKSSSVQASQSQPVVQPSTPVSIPLHAAAPKSVNKNRKRTLFEAVEIWKMRGSRMSLHVYRRLQCDDL
jgi:hypothetical protein